MLSVMLVDDDWLRAVPLTQLLTSAGYQVIAHLISTANLDQAVLELKSDIVIIDTESPSRDTLENLCVMNMSALKPIVMFTHDGDIEKMRAATKAGVSAYVVGSLPTDSLAPVINAAIVRFEEVKSLRDELGQTKLKLAERKLLEKAKGLLMKEHGFDEDHAYAMLRSIKDLSMLQKLRSFLPQFEYASCVRFIWTPAGGYGRDADFQSSASCCSRHIIDS